MVNDQDFFAWSESKKRKAMDKYEGKDADFDYLNDSREIEAGTHSFDNKPLHRINGPHSPGNAKVTRNGIEFDYDHGISDLHVRPRKSTLSPDKPYHLPTPKKMKLTVDMGGNHDQSKFKINMNVSPHLHKLDDSKIKVTVLNFAKIGKIKRNKKVLR